jgi:hypothetical protein
VLEVQPDPGPRAAPAAHGVHQDVGGLQVRPHVRVSGLPPIQPGHGLLASCRPGDLDEWHRGPAPSRGSHPLPRSGRRDHGFPAVAGRIGPGRGLAALRRLDPGRLAGLLGEVRGPRRVAQSLPEVSLGQLQQAVDRADRVVDTSCRVTRRGEPFRYGPHGERRGVHLCHLAPRQRARDPGVGSGPDRVGGGHRPVPGVLVVVDEHPVPFLLPPRRRGQLRHPPLDLPGQGQRRPANVRELPGGLDPNVDVDPPRAAGLGESDQVVFVEDLAARQRHPPDVGERHAGHRVQVHPELVGMVGILRSDRPRVQVKASEVDDPDQLGRVPNDHQVGTPAAGEVDQARLDPVGVQPGRSLLVEGLAGRPVREALQEHGPAAGPAEGPLGHREVVAHQVQLGQSQLGEEDLPRVGDRDLAAAGLDLDRFRHGQDSSRPPRSRRRGS